MLLSIPAFSANRSSVINKRIKETSQTIIFLKNLIVKNNTRAPKFMSQEFIKLMRAESKDDLLKNIDFYEQQLVALEGHKQRIKDNKAGQ